MTGPFGHQAALMNTQATGAVELPARRDVYGSVASTASTGCVICMQATLAEPTTASAGLSARCECPETPSSEGS